MSQQTRLEVVAEYFLRWMDRFPTVESLAAADEDSVLAVWQGLGYYRRCKSLRLAAAIVAREGFPTDKAGWQKLPGIGDYTSGAIASIVSGERVTAVDGNVQRVYARYHADSSHKLKKAADSWCQELLAEASPGDLNQALMELGATVCRPLSPSCSECPLEFDCEACATGDQEAYPARAKRPPMKEVRLRVLVPRCAGRYGLRKITDGPWWVGMYGFPTLTSDEYSADWPSMPLISIGEHRHTVTNHRLIFQAWVCEFPRADDRFMWVTEEELQAVALPSPFRAIARSAQTTLADTVEGDSDDHDMRKNSVGCTSRPSSARK